MHQIKRAYRTLASKEHPDNGGTQDKFRAIQQAYEVLSDPKKRSEYDATGKIIKTVEEEFVDAFAGGWSDAST
jgi:trans-2-enoyl-CoA reductase